MTTAAIVLDDVHRVYPGNVRALDGVSLEIGRGEWVALMGSSGSGKTTLLNLVDGLDRPTSGRVVILDRDTTRLAPDELTTFRREHIGLIFQQFHLIPYLTALENVMLAQYYHSQTDREQAERALEAVQMTHRATHLPSQLSGGEQQRVCIARALINEPKIILADEPTANLDEDNENKVIEILQRLHAQGETIVIATHDPGLGDLAQRKVLLRRGRIVPGTESDGGHHAAAPE
ncbi:MAG: ABC transporter ATP-binding protein [Thermoanaerobaculia bacterium]|nr:MAG: ABC transporter ATP-binding protein [Thermoanaerobaculia bacterium]